MTLICSPCPSKFRLEVKYSSTRPGARPYYLIHQKGSRSKWAPYPLERTCNTREYKLDLDSLPSRVCYLDVTPPPPNEDALADMALHLALPAFDSMQAPNQDPAFAADDSSADTSSLWDYLCEDSTTVEPLADATPDTAPSNSHIDFDPPQYQGPPGTWHAVEHNNRVMWIKGEPGVALPFHIPSPDPVPSS